MRFFPTPSCKKEIFTKKMSFSISSFISCSSQKLSPKSSFLCGSQDKHITCKADLQAGHCGTVALWRCHTKKCNKPSFKQMGKVLQGFANYIPMILIQELILIKGWTTNFICSKLVSLHKIPLLYLSLLDLARLNSRPPPSSSGIYRLILKPELHC